MCMQQRAMADPEIQTILTDPVMRQVLQDMQDNPKVCDYVLVHGLTVVSLLILQSWEQ